MAEALGIAGSVLAVVELSARIATICFRYSKEVKDAETDIKRLVQETNDLNVLARSVQEQLEGPNGSRLQTSQRLSGAFDEMTSRLTELDEKLHPPGAVLQPNRSQPHMIHRFGGGSNRNRALKWPFQKKDVDKILHDLARYRSVIMFGWQIDQMSVVSQLEDHAAQEHRLRVLSWLHPSQQMAADDVLQDLLSRRHRGTGLWLTETKPFQTWMGDPDLDLLWITGIPGTGKSFLCATMVEHLQQSISTPNEMLGHFFCSLTGQEDASSDHFLRSIAMQFTCRSPRCFEIASQWFVKKNGSQLRAQEYLGLIDVLIWEFDRVFILIDGVDEVQGYNNKHKRGEKETLLAILRFLLAPSTRKSSSSSQRRSRNERKVLMTSREDASIRANLVEQVSSYVCDLEMDHKDSLKAELKVFVLAELHRSLASRQLWLGHQDLFSQIRSRVLETGVTKLQAELQIRYISKQRNDREKRKALEHLPNTLEATYSRILISALEKYADRALEIKRTLQWLFVSVLQLTRTQLAEVISIQPEDTYLDFSGICQLHDILAPISQLVTHVTHTVRVHATDGSGTRYISQDSSVQLHHLEIKKFLTGNAIANTRAGFLHFSEMESHAFAAQVCLQYLSFADFDMDIDPEDASSIDALLTRYSFLDYAATHWATHFRLGGLATDAERFRQVRHHLTWFLNANTNPRRFKFWTTVLESVDGLSLSCHRQYRLYGDVGLYTSSALLYSISEGLDLLVEELSAPRFGAYANHTQHEDADDNNDVSTRDDEMATCLFVAASTNNLPVVRRLLVMGVDVDAAVGESERTAMHVAAENGCDDIVALLLEHGASPHVRSHSGSTPFYRAARNGSTRILRMLYAAGSEVDALTWDAWTPLMETVENNRLDAMMQLLDWGADPTHTSMCGTSPLSLSCMGHGQPLTPCITEAISRRKGEMELMTSPHGG